MPKALSHLVSLGFLLSLACGPDKPPVSPITEAEVVEPPSLPAAAPTEAPAPAAEPAAAEPAPDSNGETRTSEVIAQVIRDNRQPFRDCYEKGKKKIPELEGTLTLYFVLNPKGEVKTAELNRERSDIVEPVVVDCALGVLKGMKFPRSSRGMESTVNYPFDFKR
jgi:hypothetical protein